MNNPKAKTALKVVRRNDRAQIKRVLAGSGQALLPMLELLEGAQASIDELMQETAVALVDSRLPRSTEVVPQGPRLQGVVDPGRRPRTRTRHREGIEQGRVRWLTRRRELQRRPGHCRKIRGRVQRSVECRLIDAAIDLAPRAP